jgi:hypothetical protein
LARAKPAPESGPDVAAHPDLSPTRAAGAAPAVRLVTVHCLLSDPAPYADLGASYFETLQTPERHAEKLVRKLQRLGYTVEVKRPAA